MIVDSRSLGDYIHQPTNMDFELILAKRKESGEDTFHAAFLFLQHERPLEIILGRGEMDRTMAQLRSGTRIFQVTDINGNKFYIGGHHVCFVSSVLLNQPEEEKEEPPEAPADPEADVPSKEGTDGNKESSKTAAKK